MKKHLLPSGPLDHAAGHIWPMDHESDTHGLGSVYWTLIFCVNAPTPPQKKLYMNENKKKVDIWIKKKKHNLLQLYFSGYYTEEINDFAYAVFFQGRFLRIQLLYDIIWHNFFHKWRKVIVINFPLIKHLSQQLCHQ